jgi:hypothetical protein
MSFNVFFVPAACDVLRVKVLHRIPLPACRHLTREKSKGSIALFGNDNHGLIGSTIFLITAV